VIRIDNCDGRNVSFGLFFGRFSDWLLMSLKVPFIVQRGGTWGSKEDGTDIYLEIYTEGARGGTRCSLFPQ
jgi:hypothetical protein